jgi:lipopolysaccharide/colanic/teichoic acid biosynthesis glycosyltransferase
MFGHARVGRGGRMFRCWKIRTMVPDAESRLAAYLNLNPAAAAEWDAERKLNDDPRITRIGDIMRRTSLDELPQIWNVLIGEMSFVGPRPVTADELGKYGISRSAYCAMRPGITGLWQVSGRNEVSYAERVALDVDYLRRMSLALDLSIIARTAGVIVRPTGK